MRVMWWITFSLVSVFAVGCGSTSFQADVCGNGVKEVGEGCDDGNTADEDGCSSTCQLESCGDGIVDAGEGCDDGNQSNNDDCPDDNMAGGTCQPATCGDGVVWEANGEECDDGNLDRGDACDSDCTIPATVFRVTALRLVDPCLAAGCLFNDAANDPIATAIENDDDGDGSLDLNLLVAMKSFDQTAPGNVSTALVEGDCVPPHPGASCSQAESAVPASLTAVNSDTSNCFDPDDTASNSAEPINAVTAGEFGCFATQTSDFTLVLGTLPVPLQNGELFAQYDANPATTISGVLRGFLSGDAAAFSIIPEDIILIGGQPLTALFGIAPIEVGPDGVTPGWWVHVNFTAEVVNFKGSATCGNGVVDDGEACDPGIASGEGACEACDDGNECTTDLYVNGDPCNPTSCTHTELPVDDGSDDCCPPSDQDAAVDDPDCAEIGCGDGVLADNELCDSSAGVPCDSLAACDDGNVCTGSQFLPAEVGNECLCPLGDCTCDNFTNLGSDECLATCGDGVVTEPEACDPADPENPCDSLALCDDDDPCTVDFLKIRGRTGPLVTSECACAEGDCVCRNIDFSVIGPADGCCPDEALYTSNGDPDCSP